MGSRSQKKADQTNWDRQKALIYNALREMSPENIQHLSRIFLPMIQAGQTMGNQTALHQLQRIQAQKGIAGSPISKSQTLGFLGAQNNAALQQAFQQAFGLAGQRAGVWSGSAVPQTQPNYNMSNALLQATQQGLLAAALSKGKGQPNGPYTAAQSPQLYQQPTWGLPPSYNYGVY